MYKVKKETLNKVLQYLAHQPFGEVANLIQELQGSVKIEGDDLKKKQK